MGIYIFISVLIIIACVLQVLIVLVQNSKGGGLAANFTSAGQSMGIRKTADFLENQHGHLQQPFLLFVLLQQLQYLAARVQNAQGLKVPFRMLLIRMQFHTSHCCSH